MQLRPELEELFHQLADLGPEDRARYFEIHSTDAGVRREVEALLAADQSDRRLGSLVNHQIESILKGTEEFSEGALCGPYRLIKPIGRGGMGEVWLAERMDGFLKRPVALKLPYAGGGSGSHFAERLVREKDILASLVHPGIARLYDAGIMDGGRPFLALEYVEGTSLTAFCDERSLSLRNRIGLFLQVLSAVQYAHSHLVIHRDLKPSNILVTVEGEIKLLDFGIAKLMTDGQASETELTQLGGRALTLSYASPEQISGQSVTTASDVFSLGLILFELLCGEKAFVPVRDSRAALEDAILNADPRRPSQCVSEVQARARSTNARKLRTQLKGDLDLITLKALQKNPDRRYSTVDALRGDIERYLNGQAVLAQPERARYRIKKFIWRHKLPVVSGAAVFLALVAGLSAALWQARIARDEARTSQAVEEFTEDIFRTNGLEQPDAVKARETTARQLLDIGARKVGTSLKDAPAAKLRMLTILGSLYMDLGLPDQAVALARQRVALAKTMYGARSPLAVPALIELGNTLHASSSVKDREAVLLEAKGILDERGDFTSEDRAWLCWVLAENYASTDTPKSLSFAKDSVRIYSKWPPTREHAQAYYIAGLSYANSGDFEQSAVSLRQAIALSKKFGGDPNPDLPRYYAYQADAENSLRQYGAAEEDFRNAFKYAKAIVGAEDVDTIETESRLGTFLVLTSRSKEGLPYLENATKVCLKTKGAEDPFYTPQMLLQYGKALGANGRPEEALRYISQAVQNRRKNRPGTRYLAQMVEDQALVLVELGRYPEAERLLREAEQIHSKVGEKLDFNYQTPRLKLALSGGDLDDANRLLDRFYGPIPDSLTLSGALLSNMENRAELALRRNDGKSAIAIAHRLADLIESTHQQLYLARWQVQAMVEEGEGHLLEHDASGALPLLEKAAARETAMLHPSSPALERTVALLGIAYLDSGDRDKAEELYSKARSIVRQHPELSDRYLRPLRELGKRLGDSLAHARGS